MEFLVHIDIEYPADGDPERLKDLIAAERKRAVELREAGQCRRLWRIPGRRANWGLWEAADATELHAILTTLPLYPWLSIEVHPLAQHPSDPERPGGK